MAMEKITENGVAIALVTGMLLFKKNEKSFQKE